MQTDYSQKMKWFKFIIYVQLFLGALSSFATGITVLTGAHYGNMAEYVYLVFPGMKQCDIFEGVVSLIIAVLCIIVRQNLAHFRKGAPYQYLGLQAANIIHTLIYLLMGSSIIGVSISEFFNVNTGGTLASSIVMLVVNAVYFNNRAYMFGNPGGSANMTGGYSQPVQGGYGQNGYGQPVQGGYGQNGYGQQSLNGYGQQNYRQPVQNGYPQENSRPPVNEGYGMTRPQQPIQNGYGQVNLQKPVQGGYEQPYSQYGADEDRPTELLTNDPVDEDRPTELLSQTPGAGQPICRLIRTKTGETIVMKKFPFYIGASRDKSDYTISDSNVISRRHAYIYIEEMQFKIADLNSTNHTYLNDKCLMSDMGYDINDGDKIRLADEEFEFHLGA